MILFAFIIVLIPIVIALIIGEFTYSYINKKGYYKKEDTLASIGLLSGRLAALEILEQDIPDVPTDTAIGSLVNHITGGANAKTFQPMNVNFGLFPSIDGVKGGRKGRVERYRAYTQRAKSSWSNWLSYFDGRS